MDKNSDYVLSEWLVLNAQSGKSAAMNQLIKLWYPRFLRYSVGQLRDREAAKDTVQDALMDMAKKITTLKDPAAFPSWAYRIVHRRGVDHQRSEIRRRSRESSNRLTPTSPSDDVDPIPEVDAEMALRTALRGLDGNCYTAVHLYYLHGLSLREISTICCVPVGTVKSRLHTARGLLKNLLEEKS